MSNIFALGNDAETRYGWREALYIATETQSMFVVMEVLVGIVSLQAKRGEIKQTLELLLVVLNHPSIIQDTRSRAKLEAQLTSSQIETI